MAGPGESNISYFHKVSILFYYQLFATDGGCPGPGWAGPIRAQPPVKLVTTDGRLLCEPLVVVVGRDRVSRG